VAILNHQRMKKIILLALALLTLTSITAAKKPEKKDEEPQKSSFSGIITYYGKVTRIPDKSKTHAKLGDFEALFKLYMNDEYTRRVENYEGLGLKITITEGINKDVYFQTVSTKNGDMFVEATTQELKDYQLIAKYMRTNSLKMREVTGKKRINGYTCKKVISDIVTEDNIRIQLVAWYCPDLFIPGYQVPFFPNLKGIPLLYDTYNGEHVVTYNATDIKKQLLNNGYFSRPNMMEPMTFTEYMRKMEEQGKQEE